MKIDVSRRRVVVVIFCVVVSLGHNGTTTRRGFKIAQLATSAAEKLKGKGEKVESVR